MKSKLFVSFAWITFVVAVTFVTILAPVTRAAPTVTRIAAGSGGHTLFVESDGSLWGMGRDDAGQLGLGVGLSSTNIPVQILASNVTSVAAGSLHSLFLEADGSL